MNITVIIIVNAALSLLALLGPAALGQLAHRLPSSAPNEDERWGLDSAHVPSDPLPLGQVIRYETELKLEIARAV